MAKVLLLNVVGLTPSLLRHAPRLSSLGPPAPLIPPLPAVTCTSQATMFTGLMPRGHGVVANGWYHRDLNEVLFWRQSNRLVAGPRMWDGIPSAVLFWWFNMATTAEVTLTPRPAYPADGRKLPDVYSTPAALGRELQERLGEFPLFEFWGPKAGIGSTRWIADAAIEVLRRHDPRLCMVYLPHLDYDLQRLGPDHPSIPAEVAKVDAEAARILDAARDRQVLVVSEYGIERVDRPILLNRALREAGLLEVQRNATGELLDPWASRAFAVCDHQIAHVYVRDPGDLAAARRVVEGVAEVVDKRAAGLDHERSGEIVALAPRGGWFAYPYWLEEAAAPDFARTVDIHRKPGYDPCELLLDPGVSRAALALALLRRKLGFRTTFRVVPLDPALVRGSHGRPPASAGEGPLLLGDTPDPRPMSALFDLVRGRCRAE